MKKVQIFLIVVIAIMIGIIGAYKIDMKRMQNGEEVIFGTWGIKYIPMEKGEEIISGDDLGGEINNYQNIEIESSGEKLLLKLPKDWKYEEISGDEQYKKGIKISKENSSEYAKIGFYNGMFGVCGTDLEQKEMELKNGEKVSVGYYGGKDEWNYTAIRGGKESDAIVAINSGLKGEEAKEALRIVKNIEIK